MSKRKYKVFRDIILILLCIFPLIATLIAMSQSNVFISTGDYNEYISRFAISQDLANIIGESINTFGIAFDGAFFPAVLVIISNSLLIYLFYVFVAVIVWLPKFAIRMLNISVGDYN